MSNRIR